MVLWPGKILFNARNRVLLLCLAAMEIGAALPCQSQKHLDGGVPTVVRPECLLLDENKRPIYPGAATAAGQDVCFLGPRCVWIARNALPQLSAAKALTLNNCGPTNAKVDNIPVQEFSNFVYLPARKSLIVLDKAGDIFELALPTNLWKVFKTNRFAGSPDPEFIDLAASGPNIC